LKKKYLYFVTLSPVLIIIDQITKFYIDSKMSVHQSIEVISGLFNITYVRNPGSAFGFLAGASAEFRSIFYLIITMLAVGLILYYVAKSDDDENLTPLSLSLILSGAVGNMIDRIRFGEVIDFLDVYIGSLHWPAFNVADSAISIGAVILIVEMIRRSKEKPSEAKDT
jgi:signal peptidase II